MPAACGGAGPAAPQTPVSTRTVLQVPERSQPPAAAMRRGLLAGGEVGTGELQAPEQEGKTTPGSRAKARRLIAGPSGSSGGLQPGEGAAAKLFPAEQELLAKTGGGARGGQAGHVGPGSGAGTTHGAAQGHRTQLHLPAAPGSRQDPCQPRGTGICTPSRPRHCRVLVPGADTLPSPPHTDPQAWSTHDRLELLGLVGMEPPGRAGSSKGDPGAASEPTLARPVPCPLPSRASGPWPRLGQAPASPGTVCFPRPLPAPAPRTGKKLSPSSREAAERGSQQGLLE